MFPAVGSFIPRRCHRPTLPAGAPGILAAIAEPPTDRAQEPLADPAGRRARPAGAAVGLRQARHRRLRPRPGRARRRARLDRRHGGASWRRAGLEVRGRSTTSPASRRSWTAASRRCTRGSTPGCSPSATTPAHVRQARRARDRVRRPRLREPLPVRAHRRAAGRRRGRGHREHRHRRPDDDPRGGQEPRVRRGRHQPGVLRRGARRAARRPAGTLSLPTRESLAAEAFAYTARYDTAIARWFAEKARGLPGAASCAPTRRSLDLPYGENPHQRAAYYQQVGARRHVLSQVQPAPRQADLVQQPARPRRGPRAHARARASPACAIVKHNNPCGVGDRADDRSTPTERARVRPAQRVRRRHRAQPAGRRGDRRGALRAVRRGPVRARLRRGRARDPHAQAERPHPRGRGAPRAALGEPDVTPGRRAGCSCRTATRRSPSARRWRSSPTARPTEQEWARPALRLAGLPPREVQRDRAGPRRGDGRHRRRAR